MGNLICKQMHMENNAIINNKKHVGSWQIKIGPCPMVWHAKIVEKKNSQTNNMGNMYLQKFSFFKLQIAWERFILSESCCLFLHFFVIP